MCGTLSAHVISILLSFGFELNESQFPSYLILLLREVKFLFNSPLTSPQWSLNIMDVWDSFIDETYMYMIPSG
jgi:hypothetical protein